MKKIFILVLLLSAVTLRAQTKIERSFPVQSARQFVLEIDHPNVKIGTWDKNEIRISGSVSINHGESDSAFALTSSVESGVLTITSTIKDKDRLARHTVIKKGDREYFFRSSDWNDPEIQKFLEENGREYSYMSNGVMIDINLEVLVPKNLSTVIQARHGLVEFKSFEAPLRIQSRHGKIDATVPSGIGELVARSRHGEILTNLDMKFEQQPFEARRKGSSWTEITARPGKGYAYFLESTHGNVYLRKP